MHTIRSCLFMGLLLASNLAPAAHGKHQVGARSAGLSHATVAISDVWSGYHNQAGLARLKKFAAGVSYENQYGITELGLKSGVVVVHSQSGNFGFNFTQYGFELYQENQFSLAYSKALGKHLWAGIQLDYLQLKIEQTNGSQNAYTFEAGIQAEISPKIILGFHLYNPIQAHFKTLDYNEAIPTLARLGVAWHPSPEVVFCLETEKDLDQSPRIKSGIEYQALKSIHLRAGAANHPEEISMGLGFQYKKVKTDIAYSRHSILGYSPSISLQIQF